MRKSQRIQRSVLKEIRGGYVPTIKRNYSYSDQMKVENAITTETKEKIINFLIFVNGRVFHCDQMKTALQKYLSTGKLTTKEMDFAIKSQSEMEQVQKDREDAREIRRDKSLYQKYLDERKGSNKKKSQIRKVQDNNISKLADYEREKERKPRVRRKNSQ